MKLSNRWSNNHTPYFSDNPGWLVAWGKVASVAEGVTWRDDRIAILFTQPILSPGERFVIVGDVWFPNRSALLQKTGFDQDWQGNDLALVAHLWKRYETETWAMLPGMFALAVWDREKGKLDLGRDRCGIRTLYYTTEGSTHWVTSNPSLIPHPPSPVLDLIALRDYLCCAFVPGERTLRRSVKEVRPGTVVDLESGKVRAYWHLQEQIHDPDKSLEWHGDRLRTLLNTTIQAYLPSHEPVGVFLSGGLDSSSITALATKFHNAPVHTYSIHFGRECPNELEFSTLVANHCQTQHHILEISFKQMWEQLPETMAALDDPIGDPLTVPNLLLGRLASKSVKIVFNGEGGDPCFGGPKNQPMLINSLYRAVNQQDPLQAYLVSFQKCASDLPQLLKPEIWAAVKNEPWVFSTDLNANTSYLNRLMALNIKFKGADHILTKVNNLTQAAGIEGRSPLFDPQVVDLSMQIPPEYKLSGVQEKAVLKQAVTDLLPEAIINRPKSGMMVPVQLGFRKYWSRQARRLLMSKQAAIAPYLNQSLINDWLNYQGDTWNRYGVKLWLLVSLELWLQKKNIQ